MPDVWRKPPMGFRTVSFSDGWMVCWAACETTELPATRADGARAIEDVVADEEGVTTMSVVVRIPTPLRAITNGRGEFQVEAANVQEALDRLDQEFAGIKGRLCEDDGSVRRFVNVYVNDEDIRFMHGLRTTLKAGDEVSIVPAMAGGK